jgi:hypothetical protein
VVRPAAAAPSGRTSRPHSDDGVMINFDEDDDE